MEFLAGVVVGLLVGWNLLAQPAWAKGLVDKVKGLFVKSE
jgi:hypothetical protein